MRTLAEHTNALVQYLPGGRLFSAKYKSTSSIYKMLAGIANEMQTTDEFIKVFRTQIVPSLTEDLLPDWERAVGIPDTCFKANGDADKRRRDVLIKLASLGIQTVSDFEAIALLFGVTLTVVPGIEENGTGDADDRFRIYVRHLELPSQTFPLTFPIQFGSATLATISCLFDKLKPANCAVIFKQLGWDVDDSVYNSISFSVTTQDTNPAGMFFRNDGLRMYMIGTANDTVYQYTLSTAWDLSTASYDSVSFSVIAQSAFVTDVFFKPDGLKMYMTGSGVIYQYTLSTAWDLSTASYDTVSFSLTTQDSAAVGVFFKTDGTNLYMVGSTNDAVYQYTLSTAWDLSTASYDTISFSVSGQDLTPDSIFFKPDGSTMYILGDANNTVYQYGLSMDWDLSTASYSSKSFLTGSQDVSPRGLFFKQDDGTKMYMVGATTNTIYQYTVD